MPREPFFPAFPRNGQQTFFAMRIHIFSLLTILVASTAAQAQTPYTWNGGAGRWLDAPNWSPSEVPNSPSADVLVDGAPGTASVVTLGYTTGSAGVDFTVGRLRIDTGDRVEFSSLSNRLTFADTAFTGAGALILDGTLALPYSSDILSGPKTISGAGRLVLGGPGQRPEVTDRTVNSAIIEGSAAFGRANASNFTVLNSGLIDANIAGQDLDFHGLSGANRSVNTGTMRATNGGKLLFGQGEWLNTGATVLSDGANSLAQFYRGGLMEGGTINADGGGKVQIDALNEYTFKNITFSGSVSVAGRMLMDGTITNNGSFSVPAGGIIDMAPGVSAVTLNGSGEIVLDAPFSNRPQLIDQGAQQWTFQNVTVRGRGNVGYIDSNGSIDNVTVFNRGSFIADRPNERLHIDVHELDNQNNGVLRADGGTLSLAVSPIRNTGGLIEAINGGKVQADLARIEGGTIRNGRPAAVPPVPGGTLPLTNMTIVNPTGPGTDPAVPLNPDGMILEGNLTLGAPNSNQEARLIGEIKNLGTLRIAAYGGNSTSLRLAEAARPAVSLTGGGEVILGDANGGNDNARLFEYVSDGFGERILNNANNTIHGFGAVGGDPSYGYYLTLNNSSTIAADVADKTLFVGFNGGTNPGIIRSSNGGTLNLRTTSLNNAGGFLESLNTSPFKFTGPTQITGGTLRNVGAVANAVNFDLGNATVVNPLVLQGPIVIEHAKQTGFIGTIKNEGSVRLLNTGGTRTRLAIGSSAAPNVFLTGGGQLILENDAMINAADGVNNAVLSLDNQKLSGAGWIGAENGYTRYLTAINNSAVEADQAGKELRFTTASLTNSPGKTMKALNGGTLALWSSNLTNTGASILATNASTVELGFDGPVTGGLVSSDVGGRIRVPHNATANGGVVFTNAGTMEFGALGGDTFNGLNNGGSSIVSSGTIKKVGGSDYSIFSPLNNTGVIDVQSGILRWKGGGIVSNSSLAAAPNTYLLFQDTPFTFSGTNNLSGAGRHGFANTTVTLADATILNATIFEFGNLGTTILSGPGTLNVSGGLSILPGPTTFSGAKLITLAGSSSSINKQGSPLQFTNGATWKNYGTISMGGYINVLGGESSSLFTNMPGGIFRTTSAQENRLEMPYRNSGEFNADTGSLLITSSGTFNKGSTKVAEGFGIYPTSGTTVTFEGDANTSIGNGFFGPADASFAFNSGAKLTGENIGLYFASGVSGAGTLEVTKNLHIGKTYESPFAPNHNITVSNTLLRIAPTGTATFGINNGGGGQFHLVNGAVFENAGRMNHYYSSSIDSDGTGSFRALENSTTYFYATGLNGYYYGPMTFGTPFDVAGQVWAEQGKLVTFNQGGLFNETAKFSPNHPSSEITFTGADKVYRARGRANEFNGTGYINFVGTTLEFLPSTLSTTGNGQLDETWISAGARVAFHGDNTIKSSQALIDLGRQGMLSSTGLVFQNGDQIVDNAILKTSGGDVSVWNATGKKLVLQNGARFENGGRFVLQSRVGGQDNPGITGDSTTLFHNAITGRLIHDTNSQTDLNIDFQNDGVLEFRAGTFNFLKKFSGNGGLAASNGAKVNLSLVGIAESQHPNLLETTGVGSQINVSLSGGQTLSLNINVNGGSIVAAGGLNMVAAGGLNMVAAGGGNMVAAGGMNMVAAGGGNITGIGAGTLITTQGGDMIGADGGTLIGNDGSTLAATQGGDMIGNDGSTFVGNDGSTFKVEGGGNLIGNDGSTFIGNDGSTFVGLDGGSLIGIDGSTLIGNDGSTLVAAGGGNIAIGSGTGGRSSKTANTRLREGVAVNESKALLKTSVGANVKALSGGSIIARANGVIMGSGTFTGPGLIKNGGALVPGNSAGTLTWNGNLTVESGGLLKIEIGGVTPGTEHDRVNVSGAFSINGSLGVALINGFGSSVQAAQTFDIVTSGSAITTNLAGTRVSAAGTSGTFEVQLVNGGKTLRLTNYQAGPVTFSDWVSRYNLSGANASMTADPNNNGLSNLLEYALGLDPTAIGGTRGTSVGTVSEGGQKYLSLSYTRPTGINAPTDITYVPELATALSPPNWSSSAVDIATYSIVPGPGTLETVTVRSTHPISGGAKEFLHLKVTLSQ